MLSSKLSSDRLFERDKKEDLEHYKTKFTKAALLKHKKFFVEFVAKYGEVTPLTNTSYWLLNKVSETVLPYSYVFTTTQPFAKAVLKIMQKVEENSEDSEMVAVTSALHAIKNEVLLKMKEKNYGGRVKNEIENIIESFGFTLKDFDREIDHVFHALKHNMSKVYFS